MVSSGSMKIAVVGSGPAGAYAAYLAKRAGHDVEVFERNAHIGGRSYSHRTGGYAIDTGAAFITNFYRRVLALAPELGLSSKLVKVREPAALSLAGELTELSINSVGSFVRFPLLGVFDKLRLGLWTLGTFRKKSGYDLSDPVTLMRDDTEDMVSFGHRKLGERNTQIILRSSIEPFWFFRADQCSLALLSALSAYAVGSRIYLLEGGIDQIAARLLDDIDVHLNTPIEAVRISENSAGIEVNGQQLAFDRVVVATTASVAKRLIEPDQYDLYPDALTAMFDRQKYAANLHTVHRIDGDPPVKGIRAVYPAETGDRDLGSVGLMRALPVEKPTLAGSLISVSAMDKTSRELFALDEKEQFEKMWDMARKVMPELPKDADPVAAYRWDEAIPMQEPGQYIAAAKAIQAQKKALLPVRFCGDYFTLPWIEGALSSAEFALPEWA